MSQPSTTEPAVITAGDTISWTRALPDYPASGGWVLHYALRGPAVQDITATASGADHSISVATTGWAAGTYAVQGYVLKASVRHTVYTGNLTVKPDLAAVAGTYEARSHARRVLDAIEAVIEGRASKTDLSMSIDGTLISRIPHDQLLMLRTRYLAEYQAEQRAESVRQGRKSGRRVLMRFS